MRKVFELDDDVASFLTNALILAADRYVAIAKTQRGDTSADTRQLALQFERQERQARALVDIIGDAECVALVGDHVTGGQVREWSKL